MKYGYLLMCNHQHRIAWRSSCYSVCLCISSFCCIIYCVLVWDHTSPLKCSPWHLEDIENSFYTLTCSFTIFDVKRNQKSIKITWMTTIVLECFLRSWRWLGWVDIFNDKGCDAYDIPCTWQLGGICCRKTRHSEELLKWAYHLSYNLLFSISMLVGIMCPSWF